MDTRQFSDRAASTIAQALCYWDTWSRAGGAEGTAAPPFTIAISREAGTHGPEVAAEIGARLGWPVYDKEIFLHVAEKMGTSPGAVERVDEKRKGWLQEQIETLGSGPEVNEIAYVHRLQELFQVLAAHGQCVIVGRAAAQALPAATTLRVRLVAPLEYRSHATQVKRGVSHADAERWIHKTDRERTRFVKEYFLKDPTDPCLYDLVLNSARLSVAGCAAVIVEALRRLQAEAPAALIPAGA
jgi:cytidylate kinase